MEHNKRIYPSDGDHHKPDGFLGTITKAIGHFVGTIVGKKIEVDIIWQPPQAIYYGIPLSEIQLNAKVRTNNDKTNKYLNALDSRLIYNPGPGSILDEGVHELELVFDAGVSDISKKFNRYTKKVVSLTILPRLIPTIRFNDKSMRHNDIITNFILDAKCIDTDGTFTYSMAIGTKIVMNNDGYYKITAKFEPLDNVKYTSILKTITVTILKALPTITWEPKPLYDGQPINKDQLNAMIVEDELVDGCKLDYYPSHGHVFSIEKDDDNDIYKNDDNEDVEEIIYNLMISDMYADNLIDGGTRFDRMDPGLIIHIGDEHTFTTDRIQDGGTSTAFPEIYKDICISLSDIEKGLMIQVEAHNMDKNNKSKKLVGTGMIMIKDAIPNKDQKCSFRIPLKDQGEVTMTGKLTIADDNKVTDEQVSLLIQKINVKNLQNVGTMMDKMDPGIILKLGNLYSYKTDRACDAGTDAVFPEIFNDITLKTSDIKAGLLLEVEVHNMDKNLNSKKLIGKGNIFLDDAISQRDQMTIITVPLTPKGTITMEGTLNTIMKDDDEEDEREGPVRIRIDQLSISGVENAGSVLDKQDPGVLLHLGHISLKTQRIAEGGTDASFPEIFDDIEAHYEDHLEVEVHNIDGSGNSKKCIGKGLVVLSDVVKKQHKFIDVVIPLTNSTGNKQGIIRMRCLLEKVAIIIAEPISLNSRIKLDIDQISIKNVEDAGSVLDKQDPGLVFHIGGHSTTFKTDRVVEGGTSASFNETFNGILAKYKDTVEVEVHNIDSNGKSKKRIGKGKFRISKMLTAAGISKGITVHLVNSKHKAQGIVRFRAKIDVIPDKNTGVITVRYEPPPRMQALFDAFTATAYVKILPRLEYKLTWDMKPFTFVNSKLHNIAYFNAMSDISGYSTYYYYDPTSNEGNEWVLLTDETMLPIGIHHVCVTFTPDKPIYMIEHVYRVLAVRPKSIPWIAWESPIYMDFGALTETQLSASTNVPGSFEFSKSIGDIMDVSLTGHQVRTRFSPDDTEQYLMVEKEVIIIVPNIPSILWTISNCNSSPHSNENILYEGQPLSEDELCISILDQDLVGYGSIIYEPQLGDVIPLGIQTLKATYIIDDKFNNIYQERTVITTKITVLKKIDPYIKWVDPKPIRFGTKLKNIELNATSEIPGDFKYYPKLGTVLPMSLDGTTLKCVFHPHNRIKYNAVTKEINLIVLKAFAKIYWQFPKFLYEGQPLTEKQLAARILNEELIDGLLEYTPSLGSVLTAGFHDLTVKFIPPQGAEDSYDITETKVTITIKPQKIPDVLWTTPSAIFENMCLTSEQLNATCPRNRGKFTYNPPIDTIMSTTGNVILSVIFEPENSIEYSTIERTVELEVKEKILPKLLWTFPNPIFYGHLLTESILNATCDHDDGNILYDPPLGTKMMVTNEDSGPHILKATFIPNDTARYRDVETTVSLTVKKSTPRVKWPHQGKIFENTSLPSSLFCAKIIDDELNVEGGKFIYNPNVGEALGLGEHMLMVVYEPPSELLDRFTIASAFTKVRVIPHKVPVARTPKTLPGWEMGRDRRNPLNRPPEPKDFSDTSWGTRSEK